MIRSLFLVLFALAWAAQAAEMIEIRYRDQEPDQPAYISRILILGERMRMDYGRDQDDFVLFDRATGMVWLTAHDEKRLTGIPAEARRAHGAWPADWRFSLTPGAMWQGRVDEARGGKLCVEFRSAPILPREAGMLRDFYRALAGNQAVAWAGTPAELRDPCTLALDVHRAGAAYEQGLPLLIRYWDGRIRTYEGQAALDTRPGLFELPADYQRYVIRAGGD